MAYSDLFVVPVPKQNIEAYRKQAEIFVRVWREHGALSCIEVEGDDVSAGAVTSFPQSVALKPDETVFVGIITYQSRAHRDEVNAKAMKDPRMADMKPETMPFDGKRMFFGGFKAFVGEQSAAAGVQPYLFFRGRCEEAIEYYKATLGAEVREMLRFADNPEPPPPGMDMSAHANKIMHATVRINGADVMMSDGMRSGPLDFQCMSLTLPVSSDAEVDRLVNALAADGGTVQMPPNKTFFASRFGAVTDKFSVAWIIIAQTARQA